jgi:hypothetical protein
MKRIALPILLFALSFVNIASASADALDQGRDLMRHGRLEAAAQFFNDYARTHPRDKKLAPEALAMAGRILDALADSLTGEAEKKCYWRKGGSRTPACMQREADAFNAKFGPGSFEYEHAITFISYTGAQYRELLRRYPNSKYATEARFYILLRNLVGHPDVVLPRIREFYSKYGKGEWKDRAQLLWARVNEDVWHVHRNWSWVIYNERLDQDELIIKAEPYRQEALKTYSKLKKKKGFVGERARAEYEILNANRDDGHIYSIVNDSSPKTLAAWGVDAPQPPRAK